MFKKRTRPASVRDKPTEEAETTDQPIASGSGSPLPNAGDDEEAGYAPSLLPRK
jgi:hypothetical protein